MKISSIASAFALCAALMFAACERKTVVVVDAPTPDPVAKTKTFETTGLKNAIDRYEKLPDAANSAKVREAFAELDGEIAELERHVANKTGEERAEAAKKLANLIEFRAAENTRFAKAQGSGAPGAAIDIRVDGRSGAEKVEDAARNTGDALKNAARETGEAIKDAGKKIEEAVKDGR